MDFLAVQNELAIHFFGLVLAAGLFTLGILAFVYTFVKSGLPAGEVDVLAGAEVA
jgi:nitric oxide reductase subunit B